MSNLWGENYRHCPIAPPDKVKKRNVYAKYGEQARTVLDALLQKYSDSGIDSVEFMDIKSSEISDSTFKMTDEAMSGTSLTLYPPGCLFIVARSGILKHTLPQRRIVAKVDQLMVLVDALETQLAASRATAKNLLQAPVAELTAN